MQEPMDRIVAGRPVRDGWAAAEAAGSLIQIGRGQWALPQPARVSDWIKVLRDGNRNCRFQLLLFEYIYRRQQVPAACEDCYKVKVVPRSLRQLMALYELGRLLPFTYKCGLDAAAPMTSGVYGAYFFLHGLPAARAAYAKIREVVTADAKLGPEVVVFIKRGCTEYEVHCGPSDRYVFSDEFRKLEARLVQSIRLGEAEPPSTPQIQQTVARWIRTAYSLGDETYLDFTGGRRLYPAVVRYAPEHDPGSEARA